MGASDLVFLLAMKYKCCMCLQNKEKQRCTSLPPSLHLSSWTPSFRSLRTWAPGEWQSWQRPFFPIINPLIMGPNSTPHWQLVLFLTTWCTHILFRVDTKPSTRSLNLRCWSNTSIFSQLQIKSSLCSHEIVAPTTWNLTNMTVLHCIMHWESWRAAHDLWLMGNTFFLPEPILLMMWAFMLKTSSVTELEDPVGRLELLLNCISSIQVPGNWLASLRNCPTSLENMQIYHCCHWCWMIA